MSQKIAEFRFVITLRIVTQDGQPLVTVDAQTEPVQPAELPQLEDTPEEWYTVQCQICGWRDSYPKESNARRGLSAHTRQMHPQMYAQLPKYKRY